MEKLTITWLGTCPHCGSEEVTVKTLGNESLLYDGDDVACPVCGKWGKIMTDDGCAYVEWE